mmetsp:Transcript_11773/g.16292  ORF Transcript_11773/g.16292 Transcript_11773/m.16292 type:complete len:333 (+) Transcript_11773:384-1382(+)
MTSKLPKNIDVLCKTLAGGSVILYIVVVIVVLATNRLRWNAFRHLTLLLAVTAVCYLLFKSFWRLLTEIDRLNKRPTISSFRSTQSLQRNPITVPQASSSDQLMQNTDISNSGRTASGLGLGTSSKNALTSSPRSKTKSINTTSNTPMSNVRLQLSKRGSISSKLSGKSIPLEVKTRRKVQAVRVQSKRKRNKKRLRRTLSIFLWTIPPIWVAVLLVLGSLFILQVTSDESFSNDIDSEARGEYSFTSDSSTYVVLIIGLWFQYYAHIPFHPKIENKFEAFGPIFRFLHSCSSIVLGYLCCFSWCFHDYVEDREDSSSSKQLYLSKVSAVDV